MDENFVFSTVTMLETKNSPEIWRSDPDPIYEKRQFYKFDTKIFSS